MRPRWTVWLLLGLACSSSSNPGGGGGGSVSGVTVTGPGQVTSGLRVSLQAAVQGTSTNKDVVWSVEGGGTLADVHANPATYTAPIQSGVTTVHVKATAAADGTRIGTLDIEVDPVPLLVPAVNTAVTPTQPAIPDGHGGTLPVADSRDEHGIRSEFVVG